MCYGSLMDTYTALMAAMDAFDRNPNADTRRALAEAQAAYAEAAR